MTFLVTFVAFVVTFRGANVTFALGVFTAQLGVQHNVYERVRAYVYQKGRTRRYDLALWRFLGAGTSGPSPPP